MASAPQWKVYSSKEHGSEYIAACKYPENAAAICSQEGDGTTIRNGHSKRKTVWTEGSSGDGCANESWDVVAETCYARANPYEADDWPHALKNGEQLVAE